MRLVCFDLGGVIIKICRDLREAAAAAGVILPEALPEAALVAMTTWSWRLQRGETDPQTMAAEVARAAGGLLTAAQVEAIQAAWLLEPYAGVAELVATLEALGVATAVLSNTSPDHWEALRVLPAVRHTRHRFLSFELRAMKPEPEIYAAVERHAGLSGAAIGFFDDTEANVAAARGRGWRAAQVDHALPPAPQIEAALCRWGVAL
ncbi:MAG: HAD-IA family hydrolase [Deltaproteobacteria bacterium]|nr:HAD-IA family hydrolase [Deltaproteobacteria bacterium]